MAASRPGKKQVKRWTGKHPFSQILIILHPYAGRGAFIFPQKQKPLQGGASYVKALVLISFFQGTSRTPFVFTKDDGSGFLQDAGLVVIQRKWKKEVDWYWILDLFVGYWTFYKNLLNGFQGLVVVFSWYWIWIDIVYQSTSDTKVER